ncbi:type II/IV secretion system ATPase subunit [Thermogladius sp. 4427co]|uniref:type II/IV secretion system ATPase subunit n=1 Tax=Thermogladius sp. 4427co TaxID=3450718 RepID=UPI003F78B7FC
MRFKLPGFKLAGKQSEIAELIKAVVRTEEPVKLVAREPGSRILDSYYVYKPFVKVTIAESGEGIVYYVEEFGLTEEDKQVLDKLIQIVIDEIRPPQTPGIVKDLREYVYNEIQRIVEKYKEKLGLVGARRIKLVYYLERNLLGYGPIDPLMKDPNIEDISCNGVNTPVFVWHKKYESIPTNIIFSSEDYLNEFVMKLAHMAGKHISVAYPIVDAMLPEKHRLAATFAREVSVKGPTFTIRKFREKPFSIVELIEGKVIDSVTAAYIWTLIEHGKTAMIAGGTGAGKTSLLNAISLFIKPGKKIVTIEDTPELNLPHVNWTQLTSRETFAVGQSAGTSVRLYDLVKLSLRYRPDYIIVGEVRGEEAFVLFQSMATGHGGLSTIHAETLDYAIKRLTSPPMNIPPTYMKLMNIFLHIQRVYTRVAKGEVSIRRRVTIVQEVEDADKYITVSKWDPKTDTFVTDFSKSIHLRDIAEKRGLDFEDILGEIERKATILNWMRMKGILDAWDVAGIIFSYYRDPEAVYKRALGELEEIGIEKPAAAPVAGVDVEKTIEVSRGKG